MNVKRSGMSEQAQGKTKWRLGAACRVLPRARSSWVMPGHVSAVITAFGTQSAAPKGKWRTTNFDMTAAFSSAVRTRLLDTDHVSQRERSLVFVQCKFFVMKVDFGEEALGGCDVRTNI